jgi:hypothetical protein
MQSSKLVLIAEHTVEVRAMYARAMVLAGFKFSTASIGSVRAAKNVIQFEAEVVNPRVEATDDMP